VQSLLVLRHPLLVCLPHDKSTFASICLVSSSAQASRSYTCTRAFKSRASASACACASRSSARR
jgi:hypothetical protein